jgi:hypothetical protein
MLVLLLTNVILMHDSPLVTPYSRGFVSKSFFMGFVKNFRNGGECIPTLST